MNENNHCDEIIYTDELIDLRLKQTTGGKGFILGCPGSGQSDIAKRQIRSILRDRNDNIVVFDTEGKYVSLAEEMNGQVIRLSLAGDTHINPFDIDMSEADWDDPIMHKSNFIVAWFWSLFSPRNDRSLAEADIIRKCVRKVYEPFINSKEETNEYDPWLLPTLHDFYRVMRLQKNTLAQSMADELSCFFSDIFSHKTDISHNNRFVVYDLRECGSIFQSVCLLTSLEYVWTRYIQPQSKNPDLIHTWLFIDDIYHLLTSDIGIEYVNNLYKRSRVHMCVPTGITHYPDIFCENCDILLPILLNTDYIHLTKMPQFVCNSIFELLCLPAELMSFASISSNHSLIYEGKRVTVVSDDDKVLERRHV